MYPSGFSLLFRFGLGAGTYSPVPYLMTLEKYLRRQGRNTRDRYQPCGCSQECPAPLVPFVLSPDRTGAWARTGLLGAGWVTSARGFGLGRLCASPHVPRSFSSPGGRSAGLPRTSGAPPAHRGAVTLLWPDLIQHNLGRMSQF